MGLFNSNQQPTGETVETEQQHYMPFYSDTSNTELGKIMIDSTDFVKKIKYQLMGFVEIKENEFEQIGYKIMNEEGASLLATMASGHIGKETYLTKIKDVDVIRIIKDLWKIIDRAIIANCEKWEMPNDPSAWSTARSIVLNNIYFALRRGEDAEEKKFFAQTHESKTVSRQDANQKIAKSFWG